MGAATGGVGTGLAARAVVAAGTATLAAGAPAVAVPLAAVAGGIYMAGLRKRELVAVAGEGASQTRATRARRSRLVQSMVVLCAFLIVREGVTQV